MNGLSSPPSLSPELLSPLPCARLGCSLGFSSLPHSGVLVLLGFARWNNKRRMNFGQGDGLGLERNGGIAACGGVLVKRGEL